MVLVVLLFRKYYFYLSLARRYMTVANSLSHSGSLFCIHGAINGIWTVFFVNYERASKKMAVLSRQCHFSRILESICFACPDRREDSFRMRTISVSNPSTNPGAAILHVAAQTLQILHSLECTLTPKNRLSPTSPTGFIEA